MTLQDVLMKLLHIMLLSSLCHAESHTLLCLAEASILTSDGVWSRYDLPYRNE